MKSFDKRDKIWNSTFDTYYDCYFIELLVESLLRRWQNYDYISRILITITASGSAISGWTLWLKAGFKIMWVILAGITALLSIVHLILDTPKKIRDYIECHKLVSKLRIDLETLRQQMEIFPMFSITDFNHKLLSYRDSYSKLLSEFPDDVFCTKRLQSKIQYKLDNKINKFIQ